MLIERTLFGTVDKVADSIKLLQDNEPPESQEFIRRCHPEVIWDIPPTSMADLIVKNVIPPMHFALYCRRCLKRCFGKGRVKVTGIRAGESHGRSLKPPVDKLNKLDQVQSMVANIIFKRIDEGRANTLAEFEATIILQLNALDRLLGGDMPLLEGAA